MSNDIILEFACSHRQFEAIVAWERIMFIDKVSGKRSIYRRTKKSTDGGFPMYPNVKIYASKKGIYLRDIAVLLGVDYTSLCSMLNGRRRLKPEYMPMIADLLGVSEEVLFGGKK